MVVKIAISDDLFPRFVTPFTARCILQMNAYRATSFNEKNNVSCHCSNSFTFTKLLGTRCPRPGHFHKQKRHSSKQIREIFFTVIVLLRNSARYYKWM